MARPRLILLPCLFALACSSAGGTGPEDAGSEAAEPSDATADSPAVDATADSSGGDAAVGHVPATPSCKAGDRREWSGPIPTTFIAVAVCSGCGESYVVAANGSPSPADVTLDNSSKTITTTVPANGTATSATLADDPTNGTVKVCGTSGTQGCVPVSPENERYCNPFRSVTSLAPERIDQGVDYGGAGPIYAMGPGTIDQYHNRNDTGWPGGTFVSYKVTAGPASGKVIYLAENIDLDTSLHSGSYVYSGTVLGTLVNAYPNSESGWGVLGAGYTASYSCYTEGCMTALGVNFNDLLVCLKAPSGTMGTSGCCTSTAGYPADWCTLLAAWQ